MSIFTSPTALPTRRRALQIFAGAGACAALAARPSRATTIDGSAKIYAIKSVELIMLKSSPPQYQLRAAGTVPNDQWGSPELIPLKTDVAPGGIWEFNFMAHPSIDARAWTGHTVWTTYHFPNRRREGIDLLPRGVRIHVATGVYGKNFDGSPVDPPVGIGGDPPERDATHCVHPTDAWLGKRLVRAGQTGDGIREESLCRPYVVITPDRPIVDFMFNPGRLRLRLDAQGIIREMTTG